MTEAAILRVNEDGKFLWGRIINMKISTYNTQIIDVIEQDSKIKILMEASSGKANPIFVSFTEAGNLQLALRYGSAAMTTAWNPKAMTALSGDSLIIAYEASSANNGVFYSATSNVDVGIYRANPSTVAWHVVVDYQTMNNSPIAITKDSSYVYVVSQQTSGVLLLKLNQTSGLESGAVPKSSFIPFEANSGLKMKIDTTNNLG